MNPGAILIGIAILILAILFVIRPLENERKKQPVKISFLKEGEREERNDTLAAIRDLDFDFQTGKVTREDYESVRAELVLEAGQYLQEKKQADEKIEEMIRSRLRNVRQSTICVKCGGEIRPQDLFCPICGAPAKQVPPSIVPAAQITCPSCGKNVKANDLYCSGCGSRVDRQPAPGNTFAEN